MVSRGLPSKAGKFGFDDALAHLTPVVSRGLPSRATRFGFGNALTHLSPVVSRVGSRDVGLEMRPFPQDSLYRTITLVPRCLGFKQIKCSCSVGDDSVCWQGQPRSAKSSFYHSNP